MRIQFRLNNTPVQFEAPANERLISVLRREFGLLSMKKSCMQGICSSCTILLNQQPAPSCMIPVFAAAGQNIITLEYFSTTHDYERIMKAFKQHGITLCGFCTPATVFTAHALLKSGKTLSDRQILDAYAGNICRCIDINGITTVLKKLSLMRKPRRG